MAARAQHCGDLPMRTGISAQKCDVLSTSNTAEASEPARTVSVRWAVVNCGITEST